MILDDESPAGIPEGVGQIEKFETTFLIDGAGKEPSTAGALTAYLVARSCRLGIYISEVKLRRNEISIAALHDPTGGIPLKEGIAALTLELSVLRKVVGSNVLSLVDELYSNLG